MKERKLLLLSLAIFIYQLSIVYGQASSVGVGLEILDSSGPAVNFVHPINNSGFLHGNITLFYNVTDASDIKNCSLIINDKVNKTNASRVLKAPSTNFFELKDLSVGSYNWSINCTDILENMGENPKNTFGVNLITLFNASFNLTFINLSSVDIKNISNFVVEAPSFGTINFSEEVDLSHGFDLNSYINISFNKIELDPNVLFTLNKSATLQLTGLTFSNPRILFNGVVCPETICKEVSYSNGVLTFNVSHWTSYEAEETPGGGDSGDGGGGATGGGAGGGGGSGGGGLPVQVVTDFSVDRTTLKVVLKQGQTKTETLSIKNTGTSIFDVKAYLQGIEQFKVLPEANEVTHTLSPNEEKIIELTFKALENEKPDIYPAKITLKGPSVEKEIDTIIEVDSAEPLFDVDVEVLSESKSVFAGQEILLEVNLFNVRGFGRVDVGVEYAIKDFKGNVVATEHETLAVETQAKFSRALLVPSNLRPGNYIALVKVTYADSVGISSDVFEVKAKAIRLYPIQIKDYRVILLVGAVVIVLVIFIFSAYQFGYLKKRVPKAKVETIKQLKEEEKTQKLRKELEALESAYKSGFISAESYQKDKKRIEEKLNKSQ